MTHGTDDRARPWHLHAGARDPNTSLHDGHRSSTAADAGGLGAGGGAVATAAALRPLWLRVLTGQSVAWRIRALHRRVRRLARAVVRRRVQRLARAALRGSMHDPRARALFERGRPLAALRHARHSVPVPTAIRWPTPPAWPSDAGPVIGDRAPAGPAVWGVPPLDPAIHNPIGFVQSGTAGTVDLRVADLERHARSRASQLRRARVVVCSSTPEDEPHALAAGVVALAAQGVPLLAPSLPPAAAAIVGDELARLVITADGTDLRDDRERELHCVRLRRAAVRSHGPAARWGQIASATGIAAPAEPTLSVLMATRRPEYVFDAVRQVAAQRDDVPQLVVGLHDTGMPADTAARLRAQYPGEIVVNEFDERKNLGEVLDALVRAADGDLVSKWDDDDWYATEHLNDMRWAMRYSGAAIVGKAAEFVRLEQLDLTMRRQATGAERFSTTLAGGTLTMARADLLAIGGWPSAERQADRRLIAHVERHGGRLFRTHGFGYVLRRAGAGQQQHTWRTGDDYFVRAAIDQRPGLDLRFAGFDDVDVASTASRSAAPPLEPERVR